jgi:predicted nucleic acid-binding protein
MVLVDTSVWVHHFRTGDARLADLLERGEAAIHDFVLGELACGNLKNRGTALADLALLPRAALASTDEVLFLVERHRLYGAGLGWIDVNLLASSLLASAPIYTRDRALNDAAAKVGPAGSSPRS